MENDDEPMDMGGLYFQTNSFWDFSGMLKPIYFGKHQSNSCDAFLSLLVVGEKAGFGLAKFHPLPLNPWLDYFARIHLVAVARGPF